jgi:cell division protein FtsB
MAQMTMNEAIAVYDRATVGASGSFAEAWQIIRAKLIEADSASPSSENTSIADLQARVKMLEREVSDLHSGQTVVGFEQRNGAR